MNSRGKLQHHLAVEARRIGARDRVGVGGEELLAHRAVERRRERPQRRALEPFDDAGVVRP